MRNAEFSRPVHLDENAIPELVEGATDAIRTHRMPVHLQTLPQIPNTADCDVRPYPAHSPVVYRSQFEIVLADPETGLYFRGLAVLDDQIARVGAIVVPRHDPPQPVPFRRIGDFLLPELNASIREGE
ncbi:MAG: hypothetical protein OXD29_10130 [Roseovarius sp.]|nr:hypothetical protein [Roseovarius sp.]